MSDIRTRAIKALEGARFEDEAQREKVIEQVRLALAEEIEACAAVADGWSAPGIPQDAQWAAENIAAAIRARGQE